MRILKVRFKNLNSLAGEWEIDLTHPAFQSDGIFAITGPTGAGKSTILDAICLALYGRTPRLNKVTKSANEIISRRTGECFAEVTFETQSGRYRCNWSQHRSRKKAGGELQAPKHEIANADTGELFESKLRGVAEQIESVTGMDFERFTRSMLLAQGGFAAFLQAAADNRAPILEQITGTEIYSLISIRVHERRSQERKSLEMLTAEFAGMQLLPADEELSLQESLSLKQLDDQKFIQNIQTHNQAINWLDGIAQLEQTQQQILTQQHDWEQRHAEFQPEQQKLQCALSALELAADHAELNSIRQAQKNDQQHYEAGSTTKPELEDALKQADQVLQLAVQQLDQVKNEQKQQAQIIQKIRELDIQLNEKLAPIQTSLQAIQASQTFLEALQTKQAQDSEALATNQGALLAIQTDLEESKVDARLVEQLAGISHRFEVLQEQYAQHNLKVEERDTALKQLTEISQLVIEKNLNFETQKLACTSAQHTLDLKQDELQNIMQNQELSTLRSELSRLKDKQITLEKFNAAHQTLFATRELSVNLKTQHGELSKSLLSINEGLGIQIEKQQAKEREIQLLETQLDLITKIYDLSEIRQQLEDGKPCPLCGSEDHPYAIGNIPKRDETAQALVDARLVHKSLIKSVMEISVNQTELTKDLEQLASKQQDCHAKILECDAIVLQGCSDLELAADSPELNEQALSIASENREKISATTKLIEKAEELEAELKKLRQVFEQAKEAADQAERQAQIVAHQHENAQQAVDRANNAFELQDKHFNELLEQIQAEISVFGESVTIGRLDESLQRLTSRRDQWLERQNKKISFEQAIAILIVQTKQQSEQLRASTDELSQRQKQLFVLQTEQQSVQETRQTMYGDKNPDQEEARLTQAVDDADVDLSQKRNAQITANQDLGKLQHMLESLDKAILTRAHHLTGNENAFQLRLNQAGFSNEVHYLAACLPEDERNSLTLKAQALNHQKAELDGQAKDTTQRLLVEREKQVTQLAKDEIVQIVLGLQTQQRELQQEIGAIRQKLLDNESLKQKLLERAKLIEAQQTECNRWDMLHELIGSADGKKFRNFAQGLTFDMMIGHANRQLQKMNDRYLLIRDQTQPLELNVIDNYQAGEIRSTKNLSGGESFIVSLSLALGLSQMSSKNVRVDSLFFDEGFGTLDEEALETALETLSGLHQEGKMIGVISHVPALKERIGLQIQLVPQVGGISLISGPGCYKISY